MPCTEFLFFQLRRLLRPYCVLSDVYFESMTVVGAAYLLRLRVDAVDRACVAMIDADYVESVGLCEINCDNCGYGH
jgi:hypothetical protein